MKTQKIFSRILDVLILLVFILFFASAGFQDKSTSGWYQQFFPNMNGSAINSITFLDSLTGYAVTSTNSSVQGYIIKTTNGGDNWNIAYTYQPVNSTISFNTIKFINSNTGYASANYTSLFKTTNGGINWTSIYTGLYPQNMAVLNNDTILFVYDGGFSGGIYRTTNGGYNWQAMGQTGGSGQPSTIYMYNKDMGFCLGGQMRKTTNGGVNWFTIPGESYTSIKFVDSLTGWKTYGGVKKTTDGGLTWMPQQLPQGGQFFNHEMSALSIINKDTLWGVGDALNQNGRWFGVLFKTTNGGLNWGYQICDTSVHISIFYNIQFINKNIGWALETSKLAHTTNGGSDTTFYTGVNNNNTKVPTDYILYQNYPNPFNPFTTIKFALKLTSNISLAVFDMKGGRIKTIIDNKKINSGTYEYGFDGSNYSSGVYFYKLTINNKSVITKKMLMIK